MIPFDFVRVRIHVKFVDVVIWAISANKRRVPVQRVKEQVIVSQTGDDVAQKGAGAWSQVNSVVHPLLAKISLVWFALAIADDGDRCRRERFGERHELDIRECDRFRNRE